ncbi:conserved hypothetical protein, partial [Ricinus communis]
PHAVDGTGADAVAHQQLGDADRLHHAGRGRAGAGHAVHARSVAALSGRAAVSCDTGVGDRLHRLPDAGGPHRPRPRGLFDGAVPHRGADHLHLLRRLSLDRAGPGGTGAGPGRQPAGVPAAAAPCRPAEILLRRAEDFNFVTRLS